MKKSKLLVAVILAGMTFMATAQTNNPSNGRNGQGGGQGGGQRRGPPEQAIAACQGKSSGAACSFVGRHNNSLTGTCFAPNTNHALACRPAQGARQQGGQSNRQSKTQGSGQQEQD